MVEKIKRSRRLAEKGGIWLEIDQCIDFYLENMKHSIEMNSIPSFDKINMYEIETYE